MNINNKVSEQLSSHEDHYKLAPHCGQRGNFPRAPFYLRTQYGQRADMNAVSLAFQWALYLAESALDRLSAINVHNIHSLALIEH